MSNCRIKNESGADLAHIENEINEFFPYAKEKLGFERPVTIILASDLENAENIYGKTAFYDPHEESITLFIDKRHPKDILRSLSHELVHHSQNCRGEFENIGNLSDGYAQNDEHLRKMEAEAYLLGNGFIFRDFEDTKKRNFTMSESKKHNLTKKINNILKEHDILASNNSLRDKIREVVENILEKIADNTAFLEEGGLENNHDCEKEHPQQEHADWVQETQLFEEEVDEELDTPTEKAGRGDGGSRQNVSGASDRFKNEETLEEWKNRTLFESLTRKWTKNKE